MVNIDNEERVEKLLKETNNSDSDKTKPVKTNWSIEVIKKKRKIYLIWFLCNFFIPIIVAVLFLIISSDENLNDYLTLVSIGFVVSNLLFCVHLYSITDNVIGGHWKNVVAIAALLSLASCSPTGGGVGLLSILLIALVDNQILKTIKLREGITKPTGTTLSLLSVLSLALSCIPAIGIILGIISLRKISVKDSMLHGKPFAWIGIILNAMCTAPLIFSLLMLLYGVATNQL